jgi:ABC-type sugar transport system permease subunit
MASQTQQTATTRPTAGRLRKWGPTQQSEAYLFLLPSFAGFLLFVAAPVLGSLVLSFVSWNLLLAGSVIAMLPVLIVYLIGQRWFIKGITMTGKGGR